MAKLTKEQQFTIFSRLLNEDMPKDIALEEQVSYGTVIRLKRELEEAKANGNLDALVNLDEALLSQVFAEVQGNLPAGLQESASGVIADMKTAVTGLSILQRDMESAAATIVKQIRSKALSTDYISELDILADALCKLQNAFFNKNTTQVNVQNNYGGQQAYGSLLNDKPSIDN